MQEFTSADTSRKQVPEVAKWIINKLEKEAWKGLKDTARTLKFLDYGCGKYNLTETYIKEKYGEVVEVKSYDKYHRNDRSVLKQNEYNITMCANVLNVIKEEAERSKVIEEIHKCTERSGIAVFSIHEGNKTGKGKQTGKDSWQNNKKTKEYIREIERHFRRTEVKGNRIIAYK